jgi:HD-like signal output (HDOD) protein
MVLTGLERSFRPLRRQWISAFVQSGADALQAIDREPFDAVVTDMRMPGMDGAQLLDEVRNRSPHTIRMILSGQSDRETILRSISPAHQYIAKPCDTNDLKSKLTGAFALSDLLQNSELRATVARLKAVPSVPSLYSQILKEMDSEEPSMARLGQIVSQDPGMTAKILQVVNSAFFGLRGQIASAVHAVDILGLETVRSIILCVDAFSRLEGSLLTGPDIAWLHTHSLATAGFARRIAQLEGAESQVVDDAFTTGILHDIGKHILASTSGEAWKSALDLARSKKVTLYEAERETLGCTHAEVGAYLLGMWGLPGSIVEGVARHCNPPADLNSGFTAGAAVYAASIFHEEVCGSRLADGVTLDDSFFHGPGGDRRQQWKEACMNLAVGSQTSVL